MKKVLVIDDDSVRIQTLTEYAEHLMGPVEVTHSLTFTSDWEGYNLVMLDHDLGAGGDVSKHVRKHFPEGYDGDAWVIVHSMNPVGAREIVHTLNAGRVMPYSAILQMAKKRFRVS